MFHEEKLILGVLCWRGTPNGEWTEYTAHQLSRKLAELKKERDAAMAALEAEMQG
jgi:hypothetical protein